MLTSIGLFVGEDDDVDWLNDDKAGDENKILFNTVVRRLERINADYAKPRVAALRRAEQQKKAEQTEKEAAAMAKGHDEAA